jgi:subtilisin family serine protease
MTFYRIFVFVLLACLFAVLFRQDRLHQMTSEQGQIVNRATHEPVVAAAEAAEPVLREDPQSSVFARQLLEIFDSAVVVDALERVEPDGLLVRREVLMTDRKYPLIRREIHFRRQPSTGQWVPVEGSAHVANQVIVGLRKGRGLEALQPVLDDLDLEIVEAIHEGDSWVLQFRQTDVDAVEQVLSALTLREDVAYAEANELRLPASLPNDPGFAMQWALFNTGQGGGSPGSDIRVAQAWQYSTGAGVVVAVVDSGISVGHPDLAGAIWVNPMENANGVDDDGNGFVDDLRGWNFTADGRGNADVNDWRDGHGTLVSGIIAAQVNNQQGISGVAPAARLMAIKVMDSGSAFLSDYVAGLDYARMMGAKVINVSLGSNKASKTEEGAIERLAVAGCLLVAPSGNDGQNVDNEPEYPGCYPTSNIVNVAASDHADLLGSYSGYGALSVDLAAPGSTIYSTSLQGYRYASGTSMAVPHVAGVAALVASLAPGLDASGIKEVLMESSLVLPTLQGKVGSGGRLEAAAAVRMAMDRAFIPDGTQFYWRSNTNQRFVRPDAARGGLPVASGESADPESLWECVQVSPGLFALRHVASAAWLIEQADQTLMLGSGQASSFKPVQISAGAYAFQSAASGKWIAAEAQAQEPLVANRDAVGGWESFGIEPYRVFREDVLYRIRSGANGQYLVLDAESRLAASAPDAEQAQLWQVLQTSDGHSVLRAYPNGLYVSAENAGAAALTANRGLIREWERFVIQRHPGNGFLIKAAVNGCWVSAEDEGRLPLIANRHQVAGWEVFFAETVIP